MKRPAANAFAVLLVVALTSIGSFAMGGVASHAKHSTTSRGSLVRAAATGHLRAAHMTKHVTVHGVTRTVRQRLPFMSAGSIVSAQEALGINPAAQRSAVRNALQAPSDTGTLGCGNRTSYGNVRVNQDCTYRRQAEEDIVYNPANRSNLLAGQNDSRVGYNQTGIDWTLDNGSHWGDQLAPFRQRLNDPESAGVHTVAGGPGSFDTYDACSDPAVAFDSHGRGFYSCVAFDVVNPQSLVFVTASPAAANGSYFFNVPESGPQFIVAEDNNGLIFHDKEFITADTFKNSPNRDNVYITWTVFRFSEACGAPGAPGYCESPIYGSMSTDHAQTWSAPEMISGSSPTLCSFGNALDPSLDPNACNFDQGSDPAVLPNGDLVVAFNNGNTAAGNPNAQQLAVRCRPSGNSTAGTASLNCGAPSRVGDDVVTNEPRCDFGRGPEECIPGAYIRTNDYARIQVNRRTGATYVTWQDYRTNRFDIQLARSTDGGRTWSRTVTISRGGPFDHYMPAIDVAEPKSGARVGISFYRTRRVPNENVTPAGGFSAVDDPGVQARSSIYGLSGGVVLHAPYAFMPVSPKFAPPDGIQAGFNGDYSGLTISRGTQAHPIWSDTRNVDPQAPANGVVHDEDVFTDVVSVPGG